MEVKQDCSIINDRLQKLLDCLSKCKIDFINEREECKKIREFNAKLELELKKSRELEKSHRYHLLNSREMIGNLQDTVSQLVYLKRDIAQKETTIAALEKEKKTLLQKHNDNMAELNSMHSKQMEETKIINDRKIQQIQHDCDTQIAQLSCVIEELRCKIKDMETEHRDKMNVVVLEYEEKVQRGSAQVAQLQDQLSRQTMHTDANIETYRRRLEELEQKLKQNEFKEHLAQNAYRYESQVERPYSVNRDPFSELGSVDVDPVFETPKPIYPVSSQNKAPGNRPGALQVMYYGNKTPAVKNCEKKTFNITKKRKLYSDKDF